MPPEHSISIPIPLYARDGTVRAYTRIDAADAAFVNQWHWRCSAQGYAERRMRIDGKLVLILLHRALLGLTAGDGVLVDHINRDRLDNQRSNLRIVSQYTNSQNRSNNRGSRSPYRGVAWHTRNQQWVASVRVNGKRVRLGGFQDEREAADVARAARARHMPYAVD